jgi:hypothetical protein
MATSERVTVTLAAELVASIDRVERNRSRFIAEAVEHELERRRRDLLLQSVRQPHPETTELLDTSLADWTADLSEDEGLVDHAGGSPVRWVEGKGWVADQP